jgi:hypothetical protein
MHLIGKAYWLCMLGLVLVALLSAAIQSLSPTGSSPGSPTVERSTPFPEPVRPEPPAPERAIRPSATDDHPRGRAVPSPAHLPAYRYLLNAKWLEEFDSDAAAAIKGLPWIEDGIADEEREAAEALIELAATSRETFEVLAAKAWLNRLEFRQVGPAVVDLAYIAYEDQDAARQLVQMPFLETLHPHDLLALESLARLAYFNLPAFRNTLSHPSLRDGITDDEARVVALLDEDAETDGALLTTLLNPEVTWVEERDIGLPLAGEVTLAIFRIGPGAARSMDLFEGAVRDAERLMEDPFPAAYVPLLFAHSVSGGFAGTHKGTNITILPKFDADDGSYEAMQSARVIAHEVAHYYWRGGENWLDEGAAEFVGSFSERARTGLPLEPDNYPCDSTIGIRELEARNYTRDAAGFVCNYATGERLFLDLYRTLGEDSFLRGFRNLNALLEDTRDEAGFQTGIKEVRRAFADEAASGDGEAAAKVIERWYTGYEPGQRWVPDRGPVIAELPEVYGWIDRAYLSLDGDRSLDEAGLPVSAFAVADGGDRAWLILEYSHDYAGPPTELAFEVVECYEDGFPYRRDSLTIEAHPRYSGGARGIAIGPGPGQDWAPGRHWVYVHHEGRKVAQVEFEVTP